MGELAIAMWNMALIGGSLAGGYWFLRGQAIHKGFGFTIHWWSLVDLAAGMLIAAIAMVGIFLVQWLIGGIRVVSVQWNPAALSKGANAQFLIAPFEELLSRSFQLPGLHIALSLLLALVLRGQLAGPFERRMDRALVWCTWPAILIIAAVFGYVHIRNPGATPITAFGNALGGLMYGIAFLGGRNIWLPIGMHFSWNFVQGSVLGFHVSGRVPESLITQEPLGFDLLTGMAFRFVIIAMVLGYLYLRAGRRGNLARLEFPITVYENPPNSTQPIFRANRAGAPKNA